MKHYTFTIEGNQEDKLGNPIPYHRTTQGSRWNAASKRYNAWKTYVVAGYLDTAYPNARITREDFGEYNDLLEKKPIVKEVEGRVLATIFFGSENHADPDNIVKGILDALFVNDKHVDIETRHSCGNKCPRVELEITLQLRK